MKKHLSFASALGLALVLGCSPAAAAESAAESTGSAAEAVADADAAAAAEVGALIDAIYVQTRTEETDAQCAAAKAGWDALTEEQKELVTGVDADPDYFGRDTGDASKDDPRNQDEIGENEILVVSFGTSFNDSRAADIKGVEDAIAEANPDWSVRRAFTAQIIINHVQARDGEVIDNMEQALDRAVKNGVKNLIVQPTHLMHGAEYDEMAEILEQYESKFEQVVLAQPLLGEVGDDANVINEDKKQAAEAVAAAALAGTSYESLEEAADDGTAFVFMGHGTAHVAKISYSQMQKQMEELGYTNVLIGTVEGEPEETSCENVMETAKDAGFTKIVLRPLMVVAGDHANNDMAGDDEDSWKSMFEASGYFESVDCQIEGLGRLEDIQKIYLAHTADAVAAFDTAAESGSSAAEAVEESLADGVYSVHFTTDSSMFRVNETCGGKGTLTVENGEMTVHLTLLSRNIVNLYPGKAADAAAEGAELLQPTTDTVTYSDGTTEEVYGFDVPVKEIGADFDLALIGTKGVWYDHVVSVSDPEPLA